MKDILPNSKHRVVGVSDRQKVAFAREQRQTPTHGERLLWRYLRNQQMGPKFRRQHPIGDFVLDFYCAEARLAVEIDGPVHAKRPGYDDWRDEQLANIGIRVLRIRDEDVKHELSGVLELIREALASPPAPLSVPERGRRRSPLS